MGLRMICYVLDEFADRNPNRAGDLRREIVILDR